MVPIEEANRTTREMEPEPARAPLNGEGGPSDSPPAYSPGRKRRRRLAPMRGSESSATVRETSPASEPELTGGRDDEVDGSEGSATGSRTAGP